ncbi:MAG: HAD-IA family hydrolase [Rhodothermaceae bacterium]|nr:HAD-IA family hydrolase [Rhodothermaceae bacterium]
MTNGIRFIYFDLDDTLLDHRAAERSALADCTVHFEQHFNGHDLAHVQETYHAHNAPLWRAYGAGRIGREDLKRLRFARLLQALSIETVESEAVGAYYLQCYARHWSWTAGAETAFHALADRFPVGILTNGFAEIQQAKLDRFPELRGRAAAIVISEEVGAMKPSPVLFAHATEVVGVAPEQILYVGDSLHSDVEGGRDFGWQVAWYRGDASVRDDVLVFDDWTALLVALEV